MSRAEPDGFDHHDSARSAQAGDSPARGRARQQPATDAGLGILLIDTDPQSTTETAALLRQTFGDRSRTESVGDAAAAVEATLQDRHDVLVFAEGPASGDPAEFVRSSIQAGCRRPIIVLARNANTQVDLTVVDAGAADCIPRDELTPGLLERSIRHALLRQHSVARSQRETARLSGEITRLNTLRDANHRFVDNACHDFRSPLTVIKEFSSIIAEGLAGDVNEEQAEFLGIVLTRVDQLSQMVDAILDASRLESDLIGVRREEHSPAELIERARPTLEQQANSYGTEIRFAVEDGLPNVFADTESVGRIIVNLATNACKFAGQGGKIEVWTRHDPSIGSVTIGVTDNGPGIAPEHVKVIFDRFQQLKSDSGEVEKKGFGLGLHIASELVRVNYGTLSVESAPNAGSTFAFTLPVFDVNALIPLHFSFLKTSRHGFNSVSLAIVTAEGKAEGPELADLERFLNRQLRSYDLLLPLSDRGWLVCMACDESDLAKIIGRIQRTYSEHNRNRPNGALPDIGFRTIGTWILSGQPDGLTDAIRSAYALAPEAGAVH